MNVTTYRSLVLRPERYTYTNMVVESIGGSAYHTPLEIEWGPDLFPACVRRVPLFSL